MVVILFRANGPPPYQHGAPPHVGDRQIHELQRRDPSIRCRCDVMNDTRHDFAWIDGRPMGNGLTPGPNITDARQRLSQNSPSGRSRRRESAHFSQDLRRDQRGLTSAATVLRQTRQRVPTGDFLWRWHWSFCGSGEAKFAGARGRCWVFAGFEQGWAHLH